MRTAHRARPRGLALVLTLWLAVILITMVYALISDVQIETRLQGMTREDLEARWLANAGVARAIADLANDMVIERSEDNQQLDAHGDVWALGWEGKEDVALSDREGAGSYTVEITDAESLINVNSASVDLLQALFTVLGIEDEFEARRRAEAIIDWRDENTQPSAPLADAEFQEIEHWSTVFLEEEGLDWDGAMHNGRFLSVDELLDVPGITPELFYGEVPEDREALVDPAQERTRTRRRSESDAPVGLRDCVTVASNGQININTARREVLGALGLVAMGLGADWEEIADAVIEHREGSDEDDPDDDSPFTNVNDLANVPLAAAIASRAGDLRLNTRSQHFIIHSTGQAGSARHTVVAEVQRDWEVYVFDMAALDAGMSQRQAQLNRVLGQPIVVGAGQRGQLTESDRVRELRRRAREMEDPVNETPTVRFQTWMEY